jgi:hypothetical protein
MIAKLLRHVRRNHALEHATISLLTQRYPHTRAFGISGPRGFTLLTNLSAEEVYPAVKDAHRLLKQGRAELAIHPNCGTNLLTAALLTTVVTLLRLALGNERKFSERLERFVQLILLNTIALTLARPLGTWLQDNVTVEPEMGEMQISSIMTRYMGEMQRIEIQTRQA